MKTKRFYTENCLWKILFAVLEKGLEAEYPGVRVVRAYPPAQQVETASIRVCLHREGSRRVGAQGNHQAYDTESDTLYTTEVWQKEDSYRISAFVPFGSESEGVTAHDVMEIAAALLQSEGAIAALAREGVGIMRITTIDEPPYENSEGQWLFSASFTFILAYTQNKTRKTPVATGVDLKIIRV